MLALPISRAVLSLGNGLTCRKETSYRLVISLVIVLVVAGP